MPIGNEDVTEAATKHCKELDAQIITKAAVETATDKSYRVSWRYNTEASTLAFLRQITVCIPGVL